MDINFRTATLAEQKYTYSQSLQIGSQTGNIGYLRGDMDTNGNGFFTSWDDFRKDLKTDAFIDEFDVVVNSFREGNNDCPNFLSNRTELTKYCYSHMDSAIRGSDNRDFAFRADTEKYAYLMRLNPNRGEYNLYIYPYKRDWLDHHLQQAERGIRFITSDYKELFKIVDGESVQIKYSDGKSRKVPCRYIDDYHLEFGAELYHICQLAELLEKNGHSVQKLSNEKSKEKNANLER